MSATIGSRLREAREAKGMSIEDVAFETRIHAPYVRALEVDDYSGFAGTTYAKSFLSLYSRFLDVDAEEALQVFAGGDDIQLGGNSYLPPIQTVGSATATSAKPARGSAPPVPTPRPSRRGPGFAPVMLGIVVLALLATIPALWFLGKDVDSIDAATSKAKALAEATHTEISSSGNRAGSAAETRAPATEASRPQGERPAPKSVAADWVTESAAGPPAPGPDPTIVAVAEPAPNNLETERSKVGVPGPAKPVATPATAERETPRLSSGSNANLNPQPAVGPGPESAAPKTTAAPLRAVPFIARPIAVATGGAGSDPEKAELDEDGDEQKKDRENSSDRTNSGENRRTTTAVNQRNRFPRRQN